VERWARLPEARWFDLFRGQDATVDPPSMSGCVRCRFISPPQDTMQGERMLAGKEVYCPPQEFKGGQVINP
jgi:hypothetical protein